MSQRKVYVVESGVNGRGWLIEAMRLTHKAAHIEKSRYEDLWPSESFRVVKYIPEPPKATKKGSKK